MEMNDLGWREVSRNLDVLCDTLENNCFLGFVLHLLKILCLYKIQMYIYLYICQTLSFAIQPDYAKWIFVQKYCTAYSNRNQTLHYVNYTIESIFLFSLPNKICLPLKGQMDLIWFANK